MNDLLFMASQPPPVPAATVQPAPRKADERESVSADFEKVLKAKKKKEMRAADVSRTAHTNARRTVRSPETSSQGGTEKVEAAVHHKEVRTLKPKQHIGELDQQNESDQTGASSDQKSVSQTGDSAAGAAGIAPQALAQNNPDATAKTASANAGDPAAGADAPATLVTGQAATSPTPSALKPGEAQTGPSVDSSFSQALDQSQKGDAVKGTPADPKAGGADPAQVQAAVQQPSATLKPVQLEQPSLEKTTPADQKGVQAVQGAGNASAQSGLSHHDAGSAAAPTVVVQPAEIKTAAATQVQNAPARVETRALEMIQQVAKTVEASIQQGRNTLRMQLNPADLGAIDIRLVSSGHKVSMTVIAEQASTGRMLESQVEQLRQHLADAGVQLSQMHVSQQDAGGASSHAFAQQQPSGSHTLRTPTLNASADAETGPDRPVRLRTPGQVDYRV